ncbi:prenyltransferase [bacterium]|nr:prenyltransferase [bacterium]
MINKVSTVLECSRIFSLPMTIMSWIVVFTYAALGSGNIGYGLVALIGICLAHLGANVLDDYFDYKALIKQVDFDKKEYLRNTQKTKCRYIISGVVKEWEVLAVASVYLGIAGIIGLFFFFKCGIYVLYFGLIGGIITLAYSFLSKIRLSEIAIAIAYGPALFGGVYYVMTKTVPWEIFLLSIPTMLMTVILLYIHTVMDFDYDIKEGHYTVANSFDSQLDSLIVLKILLIAAYISPILLCIFDIADWQVFLTYLTIPLAIDLYKSMIDFSTDSSTIPEHKWFHFPMENMEMFRKMGAEAFMVRMYQSRNLMGYFAIALTVALLLENI